MAVVVVVVVVVSLRAGDSAILYNDLLRSSRSSGLSLRAVVLCGRRPLFLAATTTGSLATSFRNRAASASANIETWGLLAGSSSVLGVVVVVVVDVVGIKDEVVARGSDCCG